MSFFLDAQETATRFGNPIAEFDSLLDTNHIRHGLPEDMVGFARTLESNNQFRIELSALVKSAVKKESDEILLTDMVSIIATSVGGPSVANTNADITKPTNTLMEFLLGTGCWRQFGSASPPPSQSTTPSPRLSVRVEETRPIPISSSAPLAIASENLESRASLLEVSNELRQTLSRLEGSALEVKHHLDSIERRISRIEPLSAAIEPLTVVSPAPTSSGLEPLLHRSVADTVPHKIVQPLDEGLPAFGAKSQPPSRAVFSLQPQPNESKTEDDFSSPTFAYSAEKGRSILPIGIFLVLLAIIVAALFYARSGQGQALLEAGLLRLKTVGTLFSSAPAIAPRSPTTTLPRTPAQTSATNAVTPASPSPVAPSVPIKGTVGTASSATSEGAVPNAPPGARTIPYNPRIKHIPSSVMEGYLLSAPRPEYPPRALADHIEGQVAFQATISRTGSIQTLHAIKGPQSLRAAAIDAVRKWRYRPYFVDGRPEEVATTVYVDFTLKSPPAIAH